MINSRWNDDGTLEVLGRIDNQVKIKVRENRTQLNGPNLEAGLPRGT